MLYCAHENNILSQSITLFNHAGFSLDVASPSIVLFRRIYCRACPYGLGIQKRHSKTKQRTKRGRKKGACGKAARADLLYRGKEKTPPEIDVLRRSATHSIQEKLIFIRLECRKRFSHPYLSSRTNARFLQPFLVKQDKTSADLRL